MDFLISLLPEIEHFRFLGYWIILLVSLLKSLAFVSIAVPGTIFTALAGFVSAKGFLDLWSIRASALAADERAANLPVVFRSAPLTEFFLWITMLGKWQMILIFTLAAAVLLWLWRKKSYIIPLWLSVAGSEIFTHIGKIAFQRPRPEAALFAEHSFSFPSGHASNAIAFYGFLAYALIRDSGRRKTKVNLFFAAAAVIALIGFSRLYLGVHYVSDVWGGYLVGALWLIISVSVSEWLISKGKKSIPFSPTKKTYIISIILIFFSLLSYIAFTVIHHPQIL